MTAHNKDCFCHPPLQLDIANRMCIEMIWTTSRSCSSLNGRLMLATVPICWLGRGHGGWSEDKPLHTEKDSGSLARWSDHFTTYVLSVSLKEHKLVLFKPDILVFSSKTYILTNQLMKLLSRDMILGTSVIIPPN